MCSASHLNVNNMATFENTKTARVGQYVEINGIKIYYEEHGFGDSLVLLHGGGDESGAWAQHIPFLSKKFRVITPDSRGHGRSENNIHPLSYHLMADDTAAMIHKLGLHRPLICGWSDGANIALDLAMRYPDMAQGIICCGLFTRISDQYRQALKDILCMLAPAVVNFEKLEREAPDLVKEHRAWHSAVYGQDYWKILFKDLSVLFLTPLDYTVADYANIRIPTLILTGDRDEFLPVEEHVETYRLISGAELAIVPAASHMFPVDQVGVFDDIVLAFYHRHKSQ